MFLKRIFILLWAFLCWWNHWTQKCAKTSQNKNQIHPL